MSETEAIPKHVKTLSQAYNGPEPQTKVGMDDVTIGFYDGNPRYLVIDVGLFHVRLCDGPRDHLESLKEHLQDRITSPLKIISREELKGLRPEFDGVPSGFTVVTGPAGEIYSPEIIQ